MEGCSLLHIEWFRFLTNRNVEQSAHFNAGLHICSSLVFLLLCLINKLPLENVALNFITTLASLQGNNAGSYG